MVRLVVRDRESIQEAVRRFRKLVERSGIKKEMRRREYYEKPSEIKRRSRPSCRTSCPSNSLGSRHLNRPGPHSFVVRRVRVVAPAGPAPNAAELLSIRTGFIIGAVISAILAGSVCLGHVVRHVRKRPADRRGLGGSSARRGTGRVAGIASHASREARRGGTGRASSHLPRAAA